MALRCAPFAGEHLRIGIEQDVRAVVLGRSERRRSATMPRVTQCLGVSQCGRPLRSRPWRFAANSDGRWPKTPSSPAMADVRVPCAAPRRGAGMHRFPGRSLHGHRRLVRGRRGRAACAAGATEVATARLQRCQRTVCGPEPARWRGCRRSPLRGGCADSGDQWPRTPQAWRGRAGSDAAAEHRDWLAAQPDDAAVALHKLVHEARRHGGDRAVTRCSARAAPCTRH